MGLCCPLCGEPIAWKRRLWGMHAWAKWPCQQCGSMLKPNVQKRVFIYVATFMLAMVIMRCLVYLGFRNIYLSISAVALVVGGVVLLIIGEQVTIIEYGKGYCRNCKYNLMGLTSEQCPECGRTIVERDDSV